MKSHLRRRHNTAVREKAVRYVFGGNSVKCLYSLGYNFFRQGDTRFFIRLESGQMFALKISDAAVSSQYD
jgi:hypothetical protein